MSEVRVGRFARASEDQAAAATPPGTGVRGRGLDAAAVGRAKPTGERVLIITQVYVPDPAAVGQHIADAAKELANRGYEVVVLTANRGYDDPSVRYAPIETVDGVLVRRLPFSSFGKRSILVRLVGATLFLVQTVARGLVQKRPDAILVSTVPPMASVAALIVSLVRRAPILYWIMDLNPDLTVALGEVRPRSLLVRVFERFNTWVLERADRVVVLDRFMRERVCAKAAVGEKVTVVPPWPHEDDLPQIAPVENSFRSRHGWDDKFVFMYSGNHSPANPLGTFIEAALRLQDEERLVFAFVGGGIGKRGLDALIRAQKPRNIVSLPYQPLSELGYSLAAADVHVVTLGDPVVGMIHPCKVYGAMAVGRPVLFVGPEPSHVTDIMAVGRMGWRVAHGDVDGAVKTIREIVATKRHQLDDMGAEAKRIVATRFGKARSCGAVCDEVALMVRS